MLYMLDANVLIDANRDYYPIARVPEFWDWLEHNGLEGRVKIPFEVYDETKEGNDDLGLWARDISVKGALLLNEEATASLVSRVVNEGYAPDLTEDDIEKVGRDPFLIAYALADQDNRCVVTTEASRPTRKRSNRHVPDVCSTLGVQCCNTFVFIRDLDFKTGWRVD